MSVYKTIVTGPQVEQAVVDTLKLWLPSYVWEVARQIGRSPASVQQPRSWNVFSDLDKWPEDQVPAIVAICPGLSEAPGKSAATYRATWAVAVGAVVSGRNREESRELAGLYGAAIRAVMVQHPSLGGFAAATNWADENYDDLDTNRSRTQGIARVVFEVEVEDVTTERAGPAEPPPLPTTVNPDDPVINSVDVDVYQED